MSFSSFCPLLHFVLYFFLSLTSFCPLLRFVFNFFFVLYLFLSFTWILWIFYTFFSLHFLNQFLKWDLFFRLSNELEAPSLSPSVNWVYGYRGKDTRFNIFTAFFGLSWNTIILGRFAAIFYFNYNIKNNKKSLLI